MKRYDALTGLRGWAVLLVLIAHTSNLGYSFFGLDFSGIGKNGVYLFFALSSYLLTIQLFGLYKSGDSSINILKYILKRFSRIYPLFVMTLLLFYIISTFVSPVYITSFDILRDTILLNDGPGIFWTIAVEFKYYFLLPFIAGALYLLRAQLLLVIVLVFLLCCILFTKSKGAQWELLYYLPLFLMSSVMALVSVYGKRQVWDFTWFRILFFISLAWVFLTIPAMWSLVLHMPFHYQYFDLYFPVFCFTCPIVVYGIDRLNGSLEVFFKNRFMCHLGEISYSAYLVHMFVIYGAYYLGVAQGATIFIVILAIILVLSNLVHAHFEKPVTALLYRRVRDI